LDVNGNPTGNQVAYEIGEIPVDSDEARALGAEPLTEEKSRNFSAGFAFSPTEQITFTFDAYQIDVDDRIILTGSLEGPTVAALLAAFGAPTVKFFTNAIDTRTRGLDVTGRYRHLLDGGAYVELLAQYNRNSLEVLDVHAPDVIAELEDQVFASDDEYTIVNGRPKDRGVFRTRYVTGPLTVGVATNYWGKRIFRLEEGAAGTPDVFLNDYPNVVLDAEVSYDITELLTLAVGAENVFDAAPVVVPDGYNFQGIFPFNDSSGVSMNGRYVWSRISVRF
jgi:iron complex outermembrane receptor protein